MKKNLTILLTLVLVFMLYMPIAVLANGVVEFDEYGFKKEKTMKAMMMAESRLLSNE